MISIVLTSCCFVLASIVSAERLVRGASVWQCVPFIIASLAAWVYLWTLRAPSPGGALMLLGGIDIAFTVLAVLGIVRLLGGFDPDPSDEDEDPGSEPPEPDPEPLPWHPTQPRASTLAQFGRARPRRRREPSVRRRSRSER